MTFEELKDLEDRLLYKGKQCFKANDRFNPRSQFALLPEGYIYVGIWVNTPNSDDLSQTVQIESGTMMSLHGLKELNLGSFAHWVKESIMALEIHEVCELISFDGGRIFHPHSLTVGTTKITEENKEAA